jgi:WD40 repeat protein
MTFTRIFMGHYNLSDFIFYRRLRDDLEHNLGEEGHVESIDHRPYILSLNPEEDEKLRKEIDLLGWQLERQEENTRKIFLVIPASSPHFVNNSEQETLEDSIELACQRKDDPDPAKKVETFVILYRPCQIPPKLEGFQVFDFLPPRSYEAAFQEILVALGLPSQVVSKELPATNAGDQQPVAPPKLLATQPDAIRLARALQDHIDGISALALSADGQTLASGSRDMRIKLWNTQTGSLLRTLNGHMDTVCSLALSADGRLLASASEDNTARLWNTQTGQVLHTFTAISPSFLFRRSITLSANGSMLAVTEKKELGLEPMIQLWDLHKGKLLHSLKSGPGCMALSADGQTLICGSGKNICLWNTRKGKQIRTLSGHTESVKSVTISADGRMIASGSWDKMIKLWNPKTEQLLQTLSGHTDTVHSLALSVDGQTLASGSDNEIHLWDTQKGQRLCALKVERIPIYKQVMNKLDKVPKTIKCHTNSIQCVAMSADGSTLVSGDRDGIVIVWGVIE